MKMPVVLNRIVTTLHPASACLCRRAVSFHAPPPWVERGQVEFQFKNTHVAFLAHGLVYAGMS